MFKKTITYTDYNGVERTETFYFNITTNELIRLEVGRDGGFEAYLKKIIDAKDAPEIMEAFNSLIMLSYGIKSDDGRRFIKSKGLSEEFSQTPAYDALFLELCTNDKKAAEFVNGIMPKVKPTTNDQDKPNLKLASANILNNDVE